MMYELYRNISIHTHIPCGNNRRWRGENQSGGNLQRCSVSRDLETPESPFLSCWWNRKIQSREKKKKKRNGYKNRSGNFGGEMGFPGFDPGRGENGARFSPIPEFRVGEEASGESKLPDNFNGEREIGWVVLVQFKVVYILNKWAHLGPLLNLGLTFSYQLV